MRVGVRHGELVIIILLCCPPLGFDEIFIAMIPPEHVVDVWHPVFVGVDHSELFLIGQRAARQRAIIALPRG